MAKGVDRKHIEEEDEKEDKDKGVSDEALDLLDEDEEDVLDLAPETEDSLWE